ncbi:MAG: ribulose-phosphate 3-epimerase [Bacilli bacterium]|nr:ribulose-phosphate 3-epimerase [Bacilli bacterium]
MINLSIEGVDNMRIATSVLDCKNRIDGVRVLNGTNISYIHIDVMDGKFVPSVQFDNMGEIEEINRVSNYPLDVHLMVDKPLDYIKNLGDMNIEFITIHLEIADDKRKIFSEIRKLGYKVGLSIKPNTDIKEIEKYLDEIDLVLLMSVEPGLGGQKFIDNTVNRIKELKQLINKSNHNILIEVDGGINNETITKLESVDIAVVGSYITKSDDYNKRLEELIEILKNKDTGVINVKNGKHDKFVSKILIGIGIILIFGAGCLEIASTDFIFSFYSHPYIFLVGFLCLAVGMFMHPIYQLQKEEKIKGKVLNKKRVLYTLLLVISILIFLFIAIFSICMNGLALGSIIIVLYWPILFLCLLFSSVSIVKLNEIKRLSSE